MKSTVESPKMINSKKMYTSNDDTNKRRKHFNKIKFMNYE